MDEYRLIECRWPEIRYELDYSGGVMPGTLTFRSVVSVGAQRHRVRFLDQEIEREQLVHDGGNTRVTDMALFLAAIDAYVTSHKVRLLNLMPQPFGPMPPARVVDDTFLGAPAPRPQILWPVTCHCGQHLTQEKDEIRGALQCWKCGARYDR